MIAATAIRYAIPLVSHDGARWLPEALAGLLGQERPVQNVTAADTGSADDSAQLVTDALGADRVLHLARRTGFGQAVEEANRTAPVLTPDELTYLKRPSGWDPVTRSWRDDAYDACKRVFSRILGWPETVDGPTWTRRSGHGWVLAIQGRERLFPFAEIGQGGASVLDDPRDALIATLLHEARNG